MRCVFIVKCVCVCQQNFMYKQTESIGLVRQFDKGGTSTYIIATIENNDNNNNHEKYNDKAEKKKKKEHLNVMVNYNFKLLLQTGEKYQFFNPTVTATYF